MKPRGLLRPADCARSPGFGDCDVLPGFLGNRRGLLLSGAFAKNVVERKASGRINRDILPRIPAG